MVRPRLREGRWQAWRDVTLVAALALVVRLCHAVAVSRTPFFEGPIIDAQTYRALAERLAAGQGLAGPFYQPPLYPAFLAGLYRLGIDSSWGVAAAQIVLGSWTAVLVLCLGRAVYERVDPARAPLVGLLSGVTAALYGPFVMFDLELLPSVIVQPLVAAAVLVALRAPRVAPGRDLLAGALLGLATIGWTLSALLAPMLLAARCGRVAPRRCVGVALLLLAGMSAPVALVAWHNASHDAPGVLVSWNGGLNLWLGNNPRWRETWLARPGASFEPEFERPDREGVVQPADRSRYFARVVLRDIERRPWAAVLRTAEKLYYVWHGRELRRNQDLELLRGPSPVLRGLQFQLGVNVPFGLLAPLAALAAWRRRRHPLLRALALTVAGYGLVLACFFVSSRYRLPMVLLLIPLAADGALMLVRSPRPSPRQLAAVLTMVLVVNWPVAYLDRFPAGEAERGILITQSWRNQGEHERAEARSSALAERFPDDPNVRMLRAELLIDSGRCSAAVPHLRRTIALAPRATTPRVRLSRCLARRGDLLGAERELAMALAIHPHHPKAILDAAELYEQLGRPAAALQMLRRYEAAGYHGPGADALRRRLQRAGFAQPPPSN